MSDTFGLTQEEFGNWCKDKKEYKPLLKKKNKTATEKKDLDRMARECRDYHRRVMIEKNMKKGCGGPIFNPKLHTSKIFSDLPKYIGEVD